MSADSRHLIDPVEYGEIKAAVGHLQSQLTEIKSKQAAIDSKLDLVVNQLSEAKGGWRTLMLIGGAATTVGAAVSWVAQHLVRH